MIEAWRRWVYSLFVKIIGVQGIVFGFAPLYKIPDVLLYAVAGLAFHRGTADVVVNLSCPLAALLEYR